MIVGEARTKEGAVKLPTFTCLRCGHTWHPRKETIPIKCGRCKSPYWNTPRAKEKGGGR
jgi:predicted Zn-ribbon and HTH transcriptional regulator